MRRPARLVAPAALLVLTVACGGGDDAAPTVTAAAEPVVAMVAATTTSTSAATTTSSTTTSTTTTPPPTVPPTTAPPTAPATLPAPVDAPLEDGSSEATFEVGSIEIPAIGLWSPVFEGIRLSTLDRGPGHWPGTAMPGDVGNVVIAGHRTSHHAEFRHLDDLAPGDEVIMSTAAGRFVYQVVRTQIVRPDAVWIVDQTPARTATLFACHPPGSVRERIVAHLELVA